jgi:hypothetical protein
MSHHRITIPAEPGCTPGIGAIATVRAGGRTLRYAVVAVRAGRVHLVVHPGT